MTLNVNEKSFSIVVVPINILPKPAIQINVRRSDTDASPHDRASLPSSVDDVSSAATGWAVDVCRVGAPSLGAN